ncbi:MAG: thioesterase family protein [Defluviitaleaceae bacterium]|nr:thioesterase family protein [Defluviitaleaceae bacterium]
MNENIKEGLTHSFEMEVKHEHSAISLGSGYLPVFGTPFMIACMEQAAAKATEHLLDEGYTTVGILVNVSHLAATPIGGRVTSTAKLIKVDRSKLVFEVHAKDEKGDIGKGTHERFIVNTEKFMNKLK